MKETDRSILSYHQFVQHSKYSKPESKLIAFRPVPENEDMWDQASMKSG